MKEKKSINSDIQKILSQILKLKIIEINDQTSIFNTTKWDSLTQIQIIIALEKKFKIKFSQTEIFQLNNFMDIKKVLNKKIN